MSVIRGFDIFGNVFNFIKSSDLISIRQNTVYLNGSPLFRMELTISHLRALPQLILTVIMDSALKVGGFPLARGGKKNLG